MRKAAVQCSAAADPDSICVPMLVAGLSKRSINHKSQPAAHFIMELTAGSIGHSAPMDAMRVLAVIGVDGPCMWNHRCLEGISKGLEFPPGRCQEYTRFHLNEYIEFRQVGTVEIVKIGATVE